MLNVHRQLLYAKMKRYGLVSEDRTDGVAETDDAVEPPRNPGNLPRCSKTTVHDGAVKPPVPVPDVSVVTSDGQRAQLRDLLVGRASAIQLMFTRCRSICPIEAAAFARVQERLANGQSDGIMLLSWRIDLVTDTPEALKVRLERFGVPGYNYVCGRLSRSVFKSSSENLMAEYKVRPVFRKLKELFILPLSRQVPTVFLGKSNQDQWAIVSNPLNEASFIISAGVGRYISFEEDIIKTFKSNIVLLDPSPTGVNTMKSKKDTKNINFLEMGLAKEAGDVFFGLPDYPEEGSFRKAIEGDRLSFKCTSLPDLLKEYGKNKIDLLKIDVEGFEYEIFESIFENRIDIDQICV
jgi:FkbM family methyltransferase